MREIKFRAKRIDDGRWVYGQYFKTPLTDENSGTSPDVGWFFLSGDPRHCIVQNGVSFVIDIETLGQYTELKDKNNYEIYEGDIVEIDDPKFENTYLYRIGFSNGCFVFGGWLPREVLNMETKSKVIGNIYDDTDLMIK